MADHFPFKKNATTQVGSAADVAVGQIRFQDLVEISSDWIWEINDKGIYTYASPKVTSLLGYSPEEVVGKTPFDFMPDHEARRVGQLFRHIVERKEPFNCLENTNVHKNGQLVVLETSGVPVFDEDGRLRGYRGIDRDVTERKKFEQTLACERNRAQRCLDVAGVIMVLLDANGSIENINKHGCDVLGYTEQQLIGKNWFEHCLPSDQRAQIKELFARIMAGELVDTQYYENPVVTSSGEQRTVYWHNTTLADVHGTITHGFSSGMDVTDQRKLVGALQEEQSFITTALNTLADIFFVFDVDNRMLRWNRLLNEVSGYSDDEISRMEPYDFFLGHERLRVKAAVQEVVVNGHVSLEAALAPKAGNPIPYEFTAALLPRQGQTACIVGIGRDLRERDKTEDMQRKITHIFESSSEGIIITDTSANIIAVNRAFSDITGYQKQEVLNKNPRLLSSRYQDKQFYQRLWEAVKESDQWQGEIWNRRKTGEMFPAWVNISAVKDVSDTVTNYVGMFSDISVLKESQKQLDQLAHYDPVTNLPNRLLLTVRLEHAIQSARRHDLQTAVIFIDLCHFRDVNDSFGQLFGNHLLNETASRLAAFLRDQDTVARLNGDVFALVVEDISNLNDVDIVVRKVLEGIAEPFILENQEVSLAACIGISLFPRDGVDAQTLLKNADSALYKAKAHGYNTVEYYTAALTATAVERVTMETSLRRALSNEEFVLYYQPQLNLMTGQITGLEALIRWQHPDRGIILPMDFIPLAEQSGLIIPLGEWVLRKACAQAASLTEKGLSGVTVAVNVSARQFSQESFVSSTKNILSEFRIQPGMIEIEITESIFAPNGDDVSQALQQFRDAGLQIAIDDFGTGYSSLGRLKTMPIDRLKIDQSFIKDTPYNADDSAITKTIIGMAHSLGMQVIAEGVETHNQLEFLRQSGCNDIQGYLIAKPMPVEEVEIMMRAWDPSEIGVAC